MSSKDIGESFEATVARHYEALGFRVDRNVLLEGHQIDLLVTRYVPGAAILVYMVEAKHRGSNPVGINEITPFMNTATSLIGAGKIHGAIMVASDKISERAKAKLYDHKAIRIVSLDDLSRELFNPAESLLRIKEDYERRGIQAEYIALSGVRHVGGSAEEVPDVAEYVESWTNSDTGLLLVVGDFGSGKSTILERAFYNEANKWLRRGGGRYPILLPLRNLLSYADIWGFLRAALRDIQYMSPTTALVREKLAHGELLLLLDGFDEIYTSASPGDRAKFLKILAPLITSASPCVLSTRPTYFESFPDMLSTLFAIMPHDRPLSRLGHVHIDVKKVMGHLGIRRETTIDRNALINAVHLKPLSGEAVKLYLEKFETELTAATDRSIDELQALIYKIYDLKDLVSRPLLLNMFVVSIIKGGLQIARDEAPIGPASLYELYTQLAASRDFAKKRQGKVPLAVAEVEVRLEGCRALALAMLNKGTIELSQNEFRDAINVSGILTKATADPESRQERLERLVTDIRVCSFLAFQDAGTIRFAHKSFFGILRCAGDRHVARRPSLCGGISVC